MGGVAVAAGYRRAGFAVGALLLAAELGLESPLELAFRFALAKEGISSALIGPSSVEHLEDALRWEARGPLPQEAVERVLAVVRRSAA